MSIKGQLTADTFLNDVKDHKIKILRDDGLYRHLRFMAPGTYMMGFDLVTWPGSICYTGDIGTYVFSRIEDMFDFFRNDKGGINPRYWSENVQAEDRDGVTEYSSEKFAEVINKIVENDKHATDELREAIIEDVLRYADKLNLILPHPMDLWMEAMR